VKRKMTSPELRWTAIAHELGYHDHMHMVHDFRQLAGSTPSDIAPKLDIFLGTDSSDAVQERLVAGHG
jgi:AraC-like DNA-binding protein